MSDVRLVHGAVVVEAWDLRLDAQDRRSNDVPYRRALVHDFDDGLTMNWSEDYPSGVTLLGVRDLTAHKTGLTVSANQIVVRATEGSKTIEVFCESMRINGRLVVATPIENIVEDIEVGPMLQQLRAEVQELQARVEALETG